MVKVNEHVAAVQHTLEPPHFLNSKFDQTKSTTLENARKPIATVFYRYVYTIVLLLGTLIM